MNFVEQHSILPSIIHRLTLHVMHLLYVLHKVRSHLLEFPGVELLHPLCLRCFIDTVETLFSRCLMYSAAFSTRNTD
jgi:hypothetical protein